MSTPLLEVRGLRKSYGQHEVVRGASFSIAPGETYGLLGPNGAGKTTTISMIAGILQRDGGEVLLDGRPVSPDDREARGRIGLVPQELAVYPDLSARENLQFFGRLHGMSGRRLAGRLDEVLRVIGLADRALDRVKEYSGGMKRRLNIGIGLLHSPALLILDEPTVGVDPQSRNAILQAVEDLASAGIAVFYTTHYMEEAERLCDRVGIIDAGRIMAEGTRRELVTLVGQHDVVMVEAIGDLDAVAAAVRGTSGVISATPHDGAVQIVVEEASALLAPILREITDSGATVSGVEIQEPDLEAVFLHLTGRSLRDEA